MGNTYDKKYLSSLIEGMLYSPSKGETPMPGVILDWIEEHVGVDSNLYYGFEWCVRHGRKPYIRNHYYRGIVWFGSVDDPSLPSTALHGFDPSNFLPRSMETWIDSNVMAVFPCLADAFEAVGVYWKAHDYEHSWEVEIPYAQYAGSLHAGFRQRKSFFVVVKAKTASDAAEIAGCRWRETYIHNVVTFEICGEIVVNEKLTWE